MPLCAQPLRLPAELVVVFCHQPGGVVCAARGQLTKQQTANRQHKRPMTNNIGSFLFALNNFLTGSWADEQRRGLWHKSHQPLSTERKIPA
jgi:hypothetical protein